MHGHTNIKFKKVVKNVIYIMSRYLCFCGILQNINKKKITPLFSIDVKFVIVSTETTSAIF